MVKGVSRRVILIKSPDPRLFEEAIFIVKEDVVSKGVTQNEILKEARAVADEYIRANSKKKKAFRLPAPAYALLGAAATVVTWLAASYLF